MSNSNSELTDNDLNLLATKFKVLSEISRLRIVRTLIEGEKCVTDIIISTNLMQANVSKQLKILQGAGILECKAKGLQRFYYISDFNIVEICHILCK